MLKLISINLEGDKHHDTAVPFVKKEQPDVLCLQEVFKEDLHLYEEALGVKGFFATMAYFKIPYTEVVKTIGVAILPKPEAEFKTHYVIGDENKIPDFKVAPDVYKDRNETNIILLAADVKGEDGKMLKIATTHFTWTPDGLSTEYQKEDMRKVIKILDEELKEFIFVGDTNAPRGGESFQMLAEKYKDNIPLEYDSSIDPKLHRAPGIRFMVDGFFTTPKYSAKDVKLVEGVSDHKAVVGYIE